jgi:tetratricopeptide (TPR) repeat protein
MMPNCICRSLARFPILFALSITACGAGNKPPESANEIVPLDDKSEKATGPSSSAGTHNPTPDVSRAMKAIEAKQFAEAKEILAKSVAANANDVLANYYLGVACGGLGDDSGATAAYKRAIELDKKFAEAYVNLSALQLDLKDAAGALATAEAGLKNANNADLYLNRAIALEALGKKEESLAAYGAAVQHLPDNLSLRVTYAQLLVAGGKKDEALTQIRHVKEGDDTKLLAIAAIVARQLGAYADCVAILDRAISIKDIAALRVRRGMCREDLKDSAGAKTDYERAITMDAKFAPAHFYYGVMLQKAKEQKKACAELMLAIELAGTQGIGPEAKKASADLGCH